MTSTPTDTDVRDAVALRYAAAARRQLTVTEVDGEMSAIEQSCCGGGGCCGESAKTATISAVDPVTRDLYDADTPFDAALAASLGCGNPTALAGLRPGEDVLDLGSGGGLDVLLSARRVAPGGIAYGLDMTEEMLTLARRNQVQAGITNATFLPGHIEAVPLPDAAVDVVISNCVINLSPDKDAVLAEAFRVLRPGGRFAVADIVLRRDVPEALRGVLGLWTGCVAGALRDTDYQAKLTAAGFTDPAIEVTRSFTRADLNEMADLEPDLLPAGVTRAEAIDALDGAVVSAFVRATKPTG